LEAFCNISVPKTESTFQLFTFSTAGIETVNRGRGRECS